MAFCGVMEAPLLYIFSFINYVTRRVIESTSRQQRITMRGGFIRREEACTHLCFLLSQLQTAALSTSWHQKSIFISDFKALVIKTVQI